MYYLVSIIYTYKIVNLNKCYFFLKKKKNI